LISVTDIERYRGFRSDERPWRFRILQQKQIEYSIRITKCLNDLEETMRELMIKMPDEKIIRFNRKYKKINCCIM
jgi:hypothetical protein